MDKPRPENFGWHQSQGFDDEPSGWTRDGGEEAYNIALGKWYAEFPVEEAPMSVEEKAQKWDELAARIAKLYEADPLMNMEDDDGNLLLGDVGEAAAAAFGYL